jgi:hypothetical protein
MADPSVATDPAGDLRPVLDEELSRLPERYRAAIILCDLQGMTGEEAGRVLGYPRGTVASRLARGRERLRARLTRRGLASSSLALGLGTDSPPAALLTPLLSAGACSPQVVALAQGVLRSMLWHKLERLAVFALAESDRAYLLASSTFLLDPRRLTVAVSRAKRKMILVASKSNFSLFSPDEETYANALLWKNLLLGLARRCYGKESAVASG